MNISRMESFFQGEVGLKNHVYAASDVVANKGLNVTPKVGFDGKLASIYLLGRNLYKARYKEIQV